MGHFDQHVHGLTSGSGRIKIFVNYGWSGRIGAKIVDIYLCLIFKKNVLF